MFLLQSFIQRISSSSVTSFSWPVERICSWRRAHKALAGNTVNIIIDLVIGSRASRAVGDLPENPDIATRISLSPSFYFHTLYRPCHICMVLLHSVKSHWLSRSFSGSLKPSFSWLKTLFKDKAAGREWCDQGSWRPTIEPETWTRTLSFNTQLSQCQSQVRT